MGGEGGDGREMNMTQSIVVTAMGTERPGATLPLSVLSPLLAQQLPPLTKFGDEMLEEGETFTEWVEQLELVARACR